MDDTDGANRQDPRPDRAWLLLIHQIPAEPAYLRVKASRRLRGLGALALKNTVYALPDTAEAREDLAWVRREIVEGGGEALVARAAWVTGLTDAEVEARMAAERSAEYGALAEEAREVAGGAPARGDAMRLRRRLEEVVARDHVAAPGRAAAEHAVAQVEARVRGEDPGAGAGVDRVPAGAVWVTRRGVHVDRTASAWLIRRFLDPAARFRFVEPGDAVGAEEIPFDMFEGGYTHEGDRCTFETLVARFGHGEDGALVAIGEVVHDIDCKDGRFGRPEAAGVAGLMRGIAAAHAEDEARIAAAAAVWEALYAHFTTG